ncbi:uncharacterized protein LOC118429170 [Branchiostoma floridae]|uniref:Uncharacterized protein LOC118429170 n=1 Tax=Branchiostoma floridae TaxID=7739 RepID=A0A9J7NAM4_BRAFL|nr:uncharacterized protein LOC118429170 [Branchiostoma floridae]
MNHLSEHAGPTGRSSLTSGQQSQVVVNLFGNQNAVTTKCSSYPQVNSDSGSESSRPPSPNGTQKDDPHYVTTKTLTLLALCSTKALIPVRLLLMIVEFACNEVPSNPDSYQSQIVISLGLKFNPFLPRNKKKCFKTQRKSNLLREILGQGCAKTDGIIGLKKLYERVFCVEDDEEWHLQQQLLPHLDKWFSLVEKNELGCILSANFLTMCLHAFGKFRWTGWEDRLKNLCAKCQEKCKDAPDNKRERMFREIGETYRKLCNYNEAKRYLRETLRIHEASSSVDESLPYQISRMLLARCKSDMGEYQEAHTLMKDCLNSKAVKRLEGEFGRPYLRCRMYFEMARSCEKLGQFGDACQYCTKALEGDMREEGFRYPQYLMYAAFYKAMSAIEGNVSDLEAVLDRALRDCSKADSILRERHGEGHHHRAHVLCIQARIWLRYDPEEAFRRAKRACHITQERYGYEHNKVAKMFDLLGDIYKALDDKEKASKAYWMAKNTYSEMKHSRAGNIEEKLAEMPEFSAPTPDCTNSDVFDELLD